MFELQKILTSHTFLTFNSHCVTLTLGYYVNDKQEKGSKKTLQPSSHALNFSLT